MMISFFWICWFSDFREIEFLISWRTAEFFMEFLVVIDIWELVIQREMLNVSFIFIFLF